MRIEEKAAATAPSPSLVWVSLNISTLYLVKVTFLVCYITAVVVRALT